MTGCARGVRLGEGGGCDTESQRSGDSGCYLVRAFHDPFLSESLKCRIFCSTD
jgi:hypothetical protein